MKTGLALPTLLNVISAVPLVAVLLLIVYVLSKALKLRPKPIKIADARKEATLASLITVTSFVGVAVWRILTDTVFVPTFGKYQPIVNVRVVDVLWMVFLYVIVLPPLIIAMKRTGQNLGSVGINGNDWWRMLALGFVLSAILFTFRGFSAQYAGGCFTGFSPSLIYGFILFTIVGFGEETVWRGYIQTRLVAYGGTIKGLVVTSLLFAILWHFPSSYYLYSGVVLEALASALLRFPIGLVFGYIMLRSQNVIPSSIFHLFVNWNALFWQTPIF